MSDLSVVPGASSDSRSRDWGRGRSCPIAFWLLAGVTFLQVVLWIVSLWHCFSVWTLSGGGTRDTLSLANGQLILAEHESLCLETKSGLREIGWSVESLPWIGQSGGRFFVQNLGLVAPSFTLRTSHDISFGQDAPPSAIRLPLYLSTFLTGVPAMLLWRRRRRPRRKGYCECAHDLTGNVSGRCPECGTIIERGLG